MGEPGAYGLCGSLSGNRAAGAYSSSEGAAVSLVEGRKGASVARTSGGLRPVAAVTGFGGVGFASLKRAEVMLGNFVAGFAAWGSVRGG